MEKIKFIDLFCGVGGFHIAMEQACAELDLHAECVFASDIDAHCQRSYEVNFSLHPHGDITGVQAADIPDHDILFAGFPCQPFSIIGRRQGLADTRGTLFFDIARILEDKKPTAFVLENVKQLATHNGGSTLGIIMESLAEIGYRFTRCLTLNALDYGLPQKRERILIVGHRAPIPFENPTPSRSLKPLAEILEQHVSEKYYASARIRQKRRAAHTPEHAPSIWHENKSGNICSYPHSCALRANASHNYLLVNGERRLTSREMFRLQGFPDTYRIDPCDTQARKQAGNAVPVNMVKAVILNLLPHVGRTTSAQSEPRKQATLQK